MATALEDKIENVHESSTKLSDHTLTTRELEPNMENGKESLECMIEKIVQVLMKMQI